MGRKMKVGCSLSRCARDIYEGKVDKNDVLVIVARTDFDPYNDIQWTSIWKGYGGGETWRHGIGYGLTEWSNIPAEDEQKLRDIVLDLYDAGKIHQPRKFGAHPGQMTNYWYDVILSPTDLKNNPAAESAWEDYKIAAKLGSAKRDISLALEDNF
jgi:hypothetical protein